MKETSKALDAFVVYRDMGPKRTLKAVGETLGKSEAFIERWSFTHKWVDRAKAHDELIAQKAAAADIKARADDQERRRQNRLRIADGEQSIGATELKHLQDRLRDEKHPLKLSVQDIVRLLDHADRTQRLDTGEPTDRTEHGATDDLKDVLRTFFAAPVPHKSP